MTASGGGALGPGDEILGRYLIEALLEEHETELVYLARHQWLENDVTVRIAKATADDEERGRFERGARLVAQVRDPHVIPVVDFGVADGRPCVVVEHTHGTTVEELLATRGALPWTSAVEIATGIARGLEALHTADIIHRDLTPAGVKLTPEGVVKLTEFPLAKSLRPGQARITAVHQPIGSPIYAPPEQLMGAPVAVAGDLYALGLILHELLCGEPPWPPPRTATDVTARMDAAPPTAQPPPGLPPVPEALQAVLASLLAGSPAARPASAAAARSALLTLLGPADAAKSTQARRPTPPVRGDIVAPPPPKATRAHTSTDPLRMRPRDPWRAMAARLALTTDARPAVTRRRTPAKAAHRGLIVLATPAEALADQGLVRRLGRAAGDGAQCYAIGEIWWLAVLPADADSTPQEVADRVAALVAAEHPPEKVRSGACTVRANFAISEASARGHAAPPVEVLQLMDEVARSRR